MSILLTNDDATCSQDGRDGCPTPDEDSYTIRSDRQRVQTHKLINPETQEQILNA